MVMPMKVNLAPFALVAAMVLGAKPAFADVYRVFKLGSGALHSPAHRVYAGLNLTI